jgi:hypothetical protein
MTDIRTIRTIDQRLFSLVQQNGDPYKKISISEDTPTIEKIVFLLETIFDDLNWLGDIKLDIEP